MWPMIASGAASLLSFLGGQQTNATNLQIANNATTANMDEAARNRQFQADQTAQQMAFQERMADTAVQRQAEDMRKAGINPILAATGGAPSPAGAAASGSQGTAQSVKLDNPYASLGGMVSSALEARKMAGDIDMQSAQRSLIQAQTANQVAQAKSHGIDAIKGEAAQDAYDIVRPFVKKVKSAVQSVATPRKFYDGAQWVWKNGPGTVNLNDSIP